MAVWKVQRRFYSQAKFRLLLRYSSSASSAAQLSKQVGSMPPIVRHRRAGSPIKCITLDKDREDKEELLLNTKADF